MNEKPNAEAGPPCGWTRLFHPRGPQVTLPILDVTPAGSLAGVAAFLDAGWLVTAPGLEDGEEKETIGWVLRSTFEKEGETTPFLLLYSANDALKWSVLKIYLNTDDDIAAFEYASRMKLDALPEYVGADKPARGAAGKTDKFIVAAPRPFGVVYKKNPKHNPDTEEGKLKPARLFVRWADQKPVSSPAAHPAGQPTPAPAAESALFAHTRAINESLTLESLKAAYEDAYRAFQAGDTGIGKREIDILTKLKDERKAVVARGAGAGRREPGMDSELFPHGQNAGAMR